jgi:hypothetical protein
MNRLFDHRKILATALIILIFVFSFLYIPFGIDVQEPVDELLKIVSQTPNSKTLYLSSFDDYYQNDVKQYELRIGGLDFAEQGRKQIIQAASLGQDFFNDFLISHSVTHVLVPLTSAVRGEIRYKWGEFGAVRIQLIEPYFKMVTGSGGDFPLVLYQLYLGKIHNTQRVIDSEYELKWGGQVRRSFYELQSTVEEDGLYRYKYSFSYENNFDANWVYGYPTVQSGVAKKTEYVQFKYESNSPDLARVSIALTLVAAYGSNAPVQVLKVSKNQDAKSYILEALKPLVVTVEVESGDMISVRNVLPCRQPRLFQPDDLDLREYCFGITDIEVRTLRISTQG